MQGRARLEESGLGLELSCDTHQSTSLEAKELKEQVIDGPKIYLARG